MQCPNCFCFTIPTNAGSEIVKYAKCDNCNKCCCIFCFAKYEPINIHGNVYHRPNCKFHVIFPHKLGKDGECSECKRIKQNGMGEICRKPR